ncbi:sugar transferase [Nocardioides rotundus]|uniref:sugar transferase n=1 Tax=Nocardioides rotundus TaxID=1774216 RepID=UPI001CBBD249|nr:sugar transferase [Nocardioides rotundus]UAL30500.1 sugar transferase [Nocardioides rotundus]
MARGTGSPPRHARSDVGPAGRLGGRLRRIRIWPPLLKHGVRPLLVVSDAAACLAAALVVRPPLAAALAFSISVLALFALGDLYRSRLQLALLDDVPPMVGRILVAAAPPLALVELMASGPVGPVLTRISLTALLAGVLIFAGRSACYLLVRHLRTTGRVSHPTLIIGTSQVGRELADVLRTRREYGLRPEGFLDHRSHSGTLPVRGEPEDLPQLLAEGRIRVLVLAYGALPEHRLVELIRTCHRHRCEVFVVPRLYELHHVAGDMDMVWGMPLLRLRRWANLSPAWRLKRVLDVSVALVALLVASPVMALCAIAVRLEGGPGIIFRQERVGIDGRAFVLMKFRSLRPVDESESQTNWNIAHDDRLGPVGRRLRASSLDELPQLFNVLRGDMSLVGPRPERPHFVREFSREHPGYAFRHRVPCGLTGLAQVNGLRGDTSILQRARFDNFYIENWSLWLDIKILLRTTVAVFRAPGA